MKFTGLPFKALLKRFAAAGGAGRLDSGYGPAKTGLHRTVEQKGDVRTAAAGSQCVQLVNDGTVEVSAEPLIGNGRIGKTVAEDNAAAMPAPV